jgi:hypothetical protein
MCRTSSSSASHFRITDLRAAGLINLTPSARPALTRVRSEAYIKQAIITFVNALGGSSGTFESGGKAAAGGDNPVTNPRRSVAFAKSSPRPRRCAAWIPYGPIVPPREQITDEGPTRGRRRGRDRDKWMIIMKGPDSGPSSPSHRLASPHELEKLRVSDFCNCSLCAAENNGAGGARSLRPWAHYQALRCICPAIVECGWRRGTRDSLSIPSPLSSFVHLLTST